MDEFKLQVMWSDSHQSDMWWVVIQEDKQGKPDYYGPWFSKNTAQKFLNGELKD